MRSVPLQRLRAPGPRHSIFEVLPLLMLMSLPAAGQLPPGLIPPPTAAPAAPPVQHVYKPRAGAPPMGEWIIRAVTQTTDGPWRRLRGHAELEATSMLVRADEIDWNSETGDVVARGNLYFEQFERNEKIWADHMEYNTETQQGKFYDVRGTSAPRIDTRPGMLTSTNPYFFQGKWGERLGDRYILHDGFLTNCKVPNPWWRLKGPKFDVIPGERAKAYKSVFLLRKFPIFFTPFFYKSLEKVPRRTGFLTPNLGHSSTRGFMLGAGFFWAINRSYDANYRIQDFTARGYAHHLEFRGKPTDRSDFDVLVFGVQDRGLPEGNGQYLKQGGVTATIAGKADLGNGFTARGSINYLSSFTFREAFSDSFNEAVFTSVNSVGYVNKDWSTYTLDTVVERQQNFQTAEIMTTNPVTGKMTTESNAVIIRKLPEVDLISRDHPITDGLPFWYSLDSSAGLLSRSQPYFDSNNNLIGRYETDFFASRVHAAPEITGAFHLGDFHLIPSFSVDETYYAESQTPYENRFQVVSSDILRSAREFKVDLIAPSLERVFDHKTRFGDKLKHVIEPRVTYESVSGIGSDFNRIIRFDETDLLSNTSQVEYSLTNRLYAKRGNDVTEIFSWELAQERYFDPTFGGAIIPGTRNILLSQIELTPFTFLDGPRSYSPVVSIMRASPIPGISVDWRADYDPLHHSIADSSASIDFRKGIYFVSVGQNEVSSNTILIPSENQLRTSFGVGNQTRRGWNAAFVGIYDYRQSVLQYAIIQATYNTDCCGFSVQFRRFDFGTSVNGGVLRNENQYRFAFTVANLGSFGNLRRQERLF